MILLEFQDVSWCSADQFILRDISFQVESGDFISIVGASGSGKSTLLKLCSNLISPTLGSIVFQGKNFLDYEAVSLRKEIGYCFQAPYLFGNTVMDNFEFPYSIRKLKPDLRRINSMLSMFEMSEHYLSREVKTLSGGEKQRIALIRSLLFMPKILLLDEITSALDVENTLIVEKAMTDLNAEGVTILWVTHNPEQSRKYANKLLTLDCGRIKSIEEMRK